VPEIGCARRQPDRLRDR
jgi:transposase